VDLIKLAQDSVEWRALSKTAMIILIFKGREASVLPGDLRLLKNLATSSYFGTIWKDKYEAVFLLVAYL
jgi:hypothetical protein